MTVLRSLSELREHMCNSEAPQPPEATQVAEYWNTHGDYSDVGPVEFGAIEIPPGAA
jgi:hypothetical protein